MNCNNMGLTNNCCNEQLRYIEQIALNKCTIDCLSNRVCRNEAEIKRCYTKEELDRILACKMDRCTFKRLYCKGGCPSSICDYYTKEELDQRLDELACKCDGYTKQELDQRLEELVCKCDGYTKQELDQRLEELVCKCDGYTKQELDQRLEELVCKCDGYTKQELDQRLEELVCKCDGYTKQELDQRLEELVCKCDGYTKQELDQRLEELVCKCDGYTKQELDQRLEELVCKCDGYTKQELDQRLEELVCKCDGYTKQEIDALLDNKANIASSYKWLDLPLVNGSYRIFNDIRRPMYCIDESGVVRLRGYVIFEGGQLIPTQHEFAELPASFRPQQNVQLPVALSFSDENLNHYTDVFGLNISAAGKLSLNPSFCNPEFRGGGINLDSIFFQSGSN